MYRGRLWTMRQYAGMGDAEESNRRYKYLLSQGTTGLSVAFDLPTQIGLDSDNALAMGEVGKVGVAIDSIEDMMRLFDGINLEKISTSMTINASAAILLALYIVTAQRSGRDARKLSGTIQNDVLKEYIARGTYIYPPHQAMRIITDIFSYANEHVPEWNTISISGYHMREAGSTAVQEVAFTLANGMTYVQAAIDAGLDVDNSRQGCRSFSMRTVIFWKRWRSFARRAGCGRASCAIISARRMPSRRCCASIPRRRARLSPHSNRKTISFAPRCRRCRRCWAERSRCIPTPSTKRWRCPTEQSARIALRTQQIVAYESGAPQTIDPLAGSYYVEALTNQIEANALAYLEKIDAMGGMLKAIERGYVQQEIQNAAYEYQRAVDHKEAIVVGVNSFALDEEKKIPLLHMDESLERKQVERLRAVRAKRDQAKWQAAIKQVEDTARGAGNLMPVIVEAVEANGTVGEISDAMRHVYGEYRETVVI
jgi:methylmalonyl-CoA mutase, N-terminal domain